MELMIGSLHSHWGSSDTTLNTMQPIMTVTWLIGFSWLTAFILHNIVYCCCLDSAERLD